MRPTGRHRRVRASTRFRDRHSSANSSLILGALVAAAVVGIFVGQPSPPVEMDFRPAARRVKTPVLIRNGEFFETVADVRADAPIANATLGTEAGLRHDMTINTKIPSPNEQTFRSGENRFSFDALGAGETLTLNINGQVNPPLFAGNVGGVAIYDGDRLLGRQAVRIRVLP